MKSGKTAARDGVTVEMPSQLSEHHIETLAEAFSLRIGDPIESESFTIPGWHHLASYLIPKRHPVKLCEDLRPITIPPVLKKLYVRLLLSRMNSKLQDATP
eukprot:15253358-Heterocapsa_arctica.AAC.1